MINVQDNPDKFYAAIYRVSFELNNLASQLHYFHRGMTGYETENERVYIFWVKTFLGHSFSLQISNQKFSPWMKIICSDRVILIKAIEELTANEIEEIFRAQFANFFNQNKLSAYFKKLAQTHYINFDLVYPRFGSAA